MSANVETDVPMAVVESVDVNDMTSADYYFDSYAHFGMKFGIDDCIMTVLL